MTKTNVLKMTAYSAIALMIFLSGCTQSAMNQDDHSKMAKPMKKDTMEMKSSMDTMKKEPMMDAKKKMDSMEMKDMDEKKEKMMDAKKKMDKMEMKDMGDKKEKMMK